MLRLLRLDWSAVSIARRAALATMLAFVVAAIPAGAVAPAVSADGDRATIPALVVGDSLAVGTRPFLDPLVPGFALRWDVRNGRTTPEGMRALRALLRTVEPRAVVVSLGSNDGPSAERFQDRLRRILARIPDEACIVWPSIVRPSRKGDEAGLNRVLRKWERRDDRLVVLDWGRAVETGRVSLRDGLHPDERGYRSRSRMIAEALDDCDVGAPAPLAEDEDGSGGAEAPSL